MLNINDEGLQRAFLSWAYAMLEDGAMQELLAVGFSPETLESLRQLSAPDLETLCKIGGLGCAFSVNDREIQLAIRRVAERQKDAERIEYYVLHRAPMSLVMQLFLISAADLQSIRDSLCPEGAGGRSKMPADTKIRDAIHTAWAALCADTTVDPRDRWIILHSKYEGEYSIGTLFAVVNEFADSKKR